MPGQIPYMIRRLWARVYDERTITENGVYATDKIPESYAGALLEVEYTQLLIFGTSAGTFEEYAIMEFSGVMDEDDKDGVGFKYNINDIEVTIPPKGPSDYVMEGKVAFYNEGKNFDEVEHQKLLAQYAIYKAHKEET